MSNADNTKKNEPIATLMLKTYPINAACHSGINSMFITFVATKDRSINAETINAPASTKFRMPKLLKVLGENFEISR